MVDLKYIKTLNTNDAKNYIKENIKPLSNGDHIIKIKDKWTMIKNEVLSSVYLNRLSVELFNYYAYETDEIYHHVIEPDMPTFYDDYYNSTGNDLVIKIDNTFQFILDIFIDKKKEMKHKPQDLYELYVDYCEEKDVLKKKDFLEKLTTVGIKPVKNSFFIYKVSFDDLLDISINNGWIKKDKKALLFEEKLTKKDNFIRNLQKHIEELVAKIADLEMEAEEEEEEEEEVEEEEEELISDDESEISDTSAVEDNDHVDLINELF